MDKNDINSTIDSLHGTKQPDTCYIDEIIK